VDRITRPLASIEELAAHYVEAMRGVQPHGPYRLGGFCFSGLVAYEMARLLREQEEDLALLALIDAYPRPTSTPQRHFEFARTRFRSFKDADLGGKRIWISSRIGRLHHTGRWAAWLAAYEKIGPRVFAILEARNLQHLIPRRPLNLVYIASNLARRRYIPRPADVRIDLFHARTSGDVQSTRWDSLAGRGVERRQIAAPEINHVSMMREPHVRLLAAELISALDQATD
jgi:thioesterase domain-containing protein